MERATPDLPREAPPSPPSWCCNAARSSRHGQKRVMQHRSPQVLAGMAALPHPWFGQDVGVGQLVHVTPATMQVPVDSGDRSADIALDDEADHEVLGVVSTVLPASEAVDSFHHVQSAQLSVSAVDSLAFNDRMGIVAWEAIQVDRDVRQSNRPGRILGGDDYGPRRDSHWVLVLGGIDDSAHGRAQPMRHWKLMGQDGRVFFRYVCYGPPADLNRPQDSDDRGVRQADRAIATCAHTVGQGGSHRRDAPRLSMTAWLASPSAWTAIQWRRAAGFTTTISSRP